MTEERSRPGRGGFFFALGAEEAGCFWFDTRTPAVYNGTKGGGMEAGRRREEY